LKKRQGRLKLSNTADLILLKAGGNSEGHRDLNDIFTLFSTNFPFSLSVFVIRPEAATRSYILYLFGQGNMNFIRESQGISSSDICGNRV